MDHLFFICVCLQKLQEAERKATDQADEFAKSKQIYVHKACELNGLRDRLAHIEYEVEEARDELDACRAKNYALANANKRANADYEQLIGQQEAADKEIARLERSIDQLQAHYDASVQRLQKDVMRLEADSLDLNKQLDESGLRTQHLSKQLSDAHTLVAKHEAICAAMEREMRARDDEAAKMREALGERERLVRDKDALARELEHARRDSSEVRSQWQSCAAEKAHVEERMLLTAANMEQLQEEMRARVTECVRAEQTCQRQQTELKTLKERNTSYEEEIDELKKLADKCKRDLLACKDEAGAVHADNGKLRATVAKGHAELEASKSQEKLLYEQLAHNDALLQQAHAELRQERGKQHECQRVISQLKQSLCELNNEAESGDKQRKELLVKVAFLLLYSKYMYTVKPLF